MRKFKLALVQLKTSYISFLKGLLVTVALFVFACLFLLLGWKRITANKEATNALLKVAVVSSEEDFGTDYLLSMISGVQGVNNICTMENMEWEEASDKLSNETVDIVIKIPEDFYNKAMRMEDTRIEIYTYGTSSKLEKLLLCELKGAQDLVSVTECAIFSCYDGMNYVEVPYTKAQIEEDIFMGAISGFMNRDRIFDIEDLSVFGDFTFAKYYGISGLILFMVFAAIPLFGLYSQGDKQLDKMVYLNHVGFIQASLVRILVFTITIGSTASILVCVTKLVLGRYGIETLTLRVKAFGCIWLVAFSISIWVHLIASICGNSPHSRAMYVLLSLLMLICGGVILPIIYLPNAIRELSTVIPCGNWHTICMGALYGKRHISGINTTIITDVILAAFAAYFYLRSLVNHD